MEKPISITLIETKNKLLQCAQETNLTPVLLVPIIKDIYDMVAQAAETQYQQDLMAYQQALAEQAAKAENKENEMEEK